MDDLLRCEARYRDHYARMALTDQEGWRRPQRVARPYRFAGVRTGLAKRLIILATWLAPRTREPQTA
ncbi:MAG: hypothetical protein ACR2JW_15875 [Thermomicrobiales bacterium]